MIEKLRNKLNAALDGTLYLLVLAAVTALLVLMSTGCAATESTVCTYDAAGKMTQKVVTSESVIKTVTDSTRNKTVVMWEDGWAGYISISSGTTDDPTPHGKIFAGKINKGATSILPNQQNLLGIARIIQATKTDLSVGLDGATSASSEIQPGKK